MKHNLKNVPNVNVDNRAYINELREWFEGFEVELRKMQIECPRGDRGSARNDVILEILGE